MKSLGILMVVGLFLFSCAKEDTQAEPNLFAFADTDRNYSMMSHKFGLLAEDEQARVQVQALNTTRLRKVTISRFVGDDYYVPGVASNDAHPTGEVQIAIFEETCSSKDGLTNEKMNRAEEESEFVESFEFNCRAKLWNSYAESNADLTRLVFIGEQNASSGNCPMIEVELISELCQADGESRCPSDQVDLDNLGDVRGSVRYILKTMRSTQIKKD